MTQVLNDFVFQILNTFSLNDSHSAFLHLLRNLNWLWGMLGHKIHTKMYKIWAEWALILTESDLLINLKVKWWNY